METEAYRNDRDPLSSAERDERAPPTRRARDEEDWGEPRPRPRRRRLSGTAKALIVLGSVFGALVILGVVLVVLALCFGNPHGKEIKLNGGSQLFYTSNVTEAEARKLADYLNEVTENAPNAGTFQLNKRGDVYEVRMVVKDGVADDTSNDALMQLWGLGLSIKVFDKAPVEVHLCDRQLKTIRVLPPLGGAK
jgi:hypothetical protein